MEFVSVLKNLVGLRTFFGNESKLKFANRRIYDDLTLSNKGKMKKTKAEFHHKKAGDSSGEFFRKFNHVGCFTGLKIFLENIA